MDIGDGLKCSCCAVFRQLMSRMCKQELWQRAVLDLFRAGKLSDKCLLVVLRGLDNGPELDKLPAAPPYDLDGRVLELLVELSSRWTSEDLGGRD